MKIIFIARSLVMSLVFVGATVFLSISGILINIFFNNKKYDDKIIEIWAGLSCSLFNVKVKLHNPENIPRTGAVFLFNHSSFFDVFALAAAIPHIRFGAKVELFKIPFFGYAMKRAGTLPIARGSREEVYKVYSEAKSRIQNNECFALSPEGGRFRGDNLFPYKAGPFIFAINSGATVAPVVIKGAYEALPKSSWLANKDRWQRDVNLYFLKPISVENYTNENRQQLQKIVYDQMNSVWTNKNIP